MLGKGAFGAVYRARDTQLGRVVAIKIPRKGLLQDPEDRERFLREGRAAATLHHPNICPVHEAGELDGRQFIVMALIDGDPLARIIDRGRPLAARSAAVTVRKLALALDEAHRKGIVHRDIKPGNIMIDRRSQPMLMDFGLARRHDADEATLTVSGAIVGTPAYMAPEQALSRTDEIGPGTDIYSLGVVLYEMLTARRPFEGDATEVLGQIAETEPPPPSALRSGLDPRLDVICLKAIAKQPAARYRSMREFAEALREYLKATDPVQSNAIAALDAPEFAEVISGFNTQLATIAQRQRVTWWKWAAAVCAVGGLVLVGRFLLPRAPSTVMVRIGIDPTLLADTSLTYFLDQREITSQEAAEELPLAVGDHDLLVKRDVKIIKHYRFHVSPPSDVSGTATGRSDNQVVVLTEVNDGAKPVVELPAPAAYLGFDDAKQAGAADIAGGALRRAGDNHHRRRGVAGRAAAFSRPEDTIIVPDNPRFHSNAGFTIAAWVCPKSDHAARIAGRWSEKNAFVLSWGDGLYSFNVAFPVGGPDGTSVGVQAFGVPRSWMHVTGVYDGKRLRLYIDGQLTNSQPVAMAAALRNTPEFARDGNIPTAVQETSGPFEIGAEGFDGLIDEVKFWDDTLSDDQVAELFAGYGAPSPPSFAELKFLVPAYFYPGGDGQKEWDQLIASASNVSIVAIANPSSGAGDTADPNYTAVIGQSIEAGARVIGYVRTDYGHRPAAEVRSEIDRWLRFYPEIGGFFFDEQASGADQVDHYSELYRYAKEKLVNGIIVGNPGAVCDRGFFERPAADLFCVFENKAGLSSFQSPAGLNGAIVGRLAAVLYDVPDVDQMRIELERAAALGVEYLYLTDDKGANPWDRLPTYWKVEVEELSSQ